ncbi:MAG: hypothetical protein NT135_00150 [Candidatus Berkelbacteria bacterium]|nr:hypothetical protein [Candidatus Berkelbacteria bacterium]
MQFVNDPVKSKRVFILMLVLTIVFFLATGAFVYLFWTKLSQNRELNSQNQALTEENQKLTSEQSTATGDLQTQIDSLKKEKVALTKQRDDYKNQMTSYEAKIAKAKTYNDFFKYMNTVIGTHGGFSGWTDTEFQQGRAKAQATGDSSFITTVDWAWNQQSIDPWVRALGVWNGITLGIDNALK